MKRALFCALSFTHGLTSFPRVAWAEPTKELNQVEQAVHDALITSAIEPFICIAVCLIAYVLLSTIPPRADQETKPSVPKPTDPKANQSIAQTG